VLLRTLFAVALLTAVAGTMVHATAALTAARVHRAAALAADRSLAQTLAEVQSSIQSQITAGADPRALKMGLPPLETCALRLATSCALRVSATITDTTLKDVSTTSSSLGGCAPLCAMSLQENDTIAEGRVAVRIRVVVRGGTAVALAARDRYAVFRTFRVPPYAALAGVRDVGSDGIAIGSSEGDDGGSPIATTVNVRYLNAVTGGSIDANAWSTRSWSDSDARASGWDP
jgi:hypothetical protein